MRQNTLETLLGAIIIVGALLFAITVYNSANITPSEGIELKAEFGDVSGLSKGDDVFLSGIKIGQVTSYEIDKKIVKMKLENKKIEFRKVNISQNAHKCALF